MASPDAKEKAIKHYLSILMKEKQDLFSQKIDPKDEYHYVEAFINNFYQTQKGLFNSFEKEFALAKQNMLEAFNGHGYLPKIKTFLKQSDEEIIKKLALYFAYGNAITRVDTLFPKKKDKTIKNKKTNSEILAGINSKNIEEHYKDIFRSTDHLKKIDGLIDELFDDEGVWLGHTGKKQEVAALIWVLTEKGYLKRKPLNYAAKIFSIKYKIDAAIRTLTTKGNSFTYACEYFSEYFPDINFASDVK